MSETIDIDELIRLAYAKGHAEGMQDILAVADMKDRDFLAGLAEKTAVALEVMQEPIAEARIAGYLL